MGHVWPCCYLSLLQLDSAPFFLRRFIALRRRSRYPVAHQARGAGLYHRADLLPVRGDFFTDEDGKIERGTLGTFSRFGRWSSWKGMI